MNPLKDIMGLFLPRVCAMCGKPLPESLEFLCTNCRWEMPLTGFGSRFDNPVIERLHGMLPLVNASSYLWFADGGNVRAMIHAFKYRGNWRYAYEAGKWYGSELKNGGLYGDVDVVVPVPLHFKKLLRRGYNQAEYIARGMASVMGVLVDSRSVVRSRYNRSQTERSKSERWENVEGIFAVKHPSNLAGMHILLVDDVLTTGATIISCARTILDTVPNCRLSIATLAVSRAEFGDFK